MSTSEHLEGTGGASAPGSERPWLGRYAKLVVLATFVLIFRGAIVTTYGSGMAVPDWPLSFGSLNPAGWVQNTPVFQEHAHRLLALTVGFMTVLLCAWIWRAWWAFATSVLLSMALPPIAATLGASRPLIMHLALWPSAIVFIGALLLRWGRESRNGTGSSEPLKWLAVAAVMSVCIQGVFGGLRVTEQTAGDLTSATILRVVHGTFAQVFLCVNVAIATLLSPAWKEGRATKAAGRIPNRLVWVLFAALFMQLIFGATMRHLGAGLAIPTFPQASPTGSWMPSVHNALVDTNFSHTRFGSMLVTILVAIVALRTVRTGSGVFRLTQPAWALLALVAIQFILGVFVVWHTRPPTITTLHVVNGAILLATTLLLALRLNAVRRSDFSTAMTSTHGNSTEGMR